MLVPKPEVTDDSPQPVSRPGRSVARHAPLITILAFRLLALKTDCTITLRSA
jgi:hypothetical protein